MPKQLTVLFQRLAFFIGSIQIQDFVFWICLYKPFLLLSILDMNAGALRLKSVKFHHGATSQPHSLTPYGHKGVDQTL